MQEGFHHVTQADVAALAGVSRGLVSLVLRGEGRVSENTRKRILAAADKLSYQPNLAAAQLAAKKSQFIFLLVPNFENPFFNEVAQGLQQAALGRGLTLVMASSGSNAKEELQALERVYQIRPAGVVIAWPFSDDEILESYGLHTPLCVLTQNRNLKTVGSVYMDEAKAARLIVDHIASQGVEKLCFITPDNEVEEYVNQLREQAVAQAALTAGIAFTKIQHQLPTGALLIDLLADSSQQKALVAYNDLLAIRILAALKEIEQPLLKPLLISYDDTFFAKVPEISLSSISQNPIEMGKKCISILLARNTGDKEMMVLPPSLFIRDSSTVE